MVPAPPDPLDAPLADWFTSGPFHGEPVTFGPPTLVEVPGDDDEPETWRVVAVRSPRRAAVGVIGPLPLRPGDPPPIAWTTYAEPGSATPTEHVAEVRARLVRAGRLGPLASAPGPTVDVAPARAFRGEPGVVQWRHGGVRVVMVLSGAGSWDDGAEAADWVAGELASRPDVVRPRALAHRLAWLTDLARDRFRSGGDDPHDGITFSATAVVAAPDGISVVACGRFAAVVVDGAGARAVHLPRTYSDHLVEQGQLSPSEAASHPSAGIMTGPFLGPLPSVVPEVLGPFPVDLDAVLIVDREAARDLLRGAPDVARRISAAGLQALGRPYLPAVVVRPR